MKFCCLGCEWGNDSGGGESYYKGGKPRQASLKPQFQPASRHRAGPPETTTRNDPQTTINWQFVICEPGSCKARLLNIGWSWNAMPSARSSSTHAMWEPRRHPADPCSTRVGPSRCFENQAARLALQHPNKQPNSRTHNGG
jgi:hypothetical protein